MPPGTTSNGAEDSTGVEPRWLAMVAIIGVLTGVVGMPDLQEPVAAYDKQSVGGMTTEVAT